MSPDEMSQAQKTSCRRARRTACLGYFILELFYHSQYWQILFSSQISVLQPFPTICLPSFPLLFFSCGSPYVLLSTGVATALLSHPLRVIPASVHLRSLWQCISNYFLTSACLPSVCLSRYHCQSLKFIVAKNMFLIHIPHSMFPRCITLIFPSL